MQNEVKQKNTAFILIRAIKTSEHIVAVDKLDAIEDIARMLTDEEYAKRVDFKDEVLIISTLVVELLLCLFDNNKSDLGEDFYLALRLNLSRSNRSIDSIITKNRFYTLNIIKRGDPPKNFGKPREIARSIIYSLEGNFFVTEEDSLAAIEDIKLMLDDRKYAKSVDFGSYKFDYANKESYLLSLFTLSKTKLGEIFYKAIALNLERSVLRGYNEFFGSYK